MAPLPFRDTDLPPAESSLGLISQRRLSGDIECGSHAERLTDFIQSKIERSGALSAIPSVTAQMATRFDETYSQNQQTMAAANLALSEIQDDFSRLPTSQHTMTGRLPVEERRNMHRCQTAQLAENRKPRKDRASKPTLTRQEQYEQYLNVTSPTSDRIYRSVGELVTTHHRQLAQLQETMGSTVAGGPSKEGLRERRIQDAENRRCSSPIRRCAPHNPEGWDFPYPYDPPPAVPTSINTVPQWRLG